MTNSKALAQACGKRMKPPFHRHIVLSGGLDQMSSTCAPELVNTVLRGHRKQMLDNGWISELDLQCTVPSPSGPIFDLKDGSATQWVDEFDDHTGAQLPRDFVHAGKMEEICSVKETGLNKKISRAEGKAQRLHSCANQVRCDRQRRPKQTEREMQTCGQRVAFEDERNLLCARSYQCNAPWKSSKCCWDFL